MKQFIGVIGFAALAACGAGNTADPSTTVVGSNPTVLKQSQFEAGGAAVSSRLKNPASAQWVNIQGAVLTYGDGSQRLAACGMVNAKISFGGYTGSKMYFVLYDDNGIAVPVMDAGAVCQFYGIV